MWEGVEAMRLVEEGAVVDEVVHGVTALFLCCMSGFSDSNVDLIRMLLERGADPNFREKGRGLTVLHVACSNIHWEPRSEEVIRLLLDRGADANAEDYKYSTPSNMPLPWVGGSVLEVLRQYGAREHGWTSLHAACAKDLATEAHDPAAQAAADTRGWTPVHVACEAGSANSLRAMIARNRDCASYRTRDRNQLTPLHIACHGNKLEIVELLIGVCDVNALDSGSETPLHAACDGGHSEIVERLLGAGADPSAADCRGCTALHRAALRGDFRSLAALVAAGADIHCRDDSWLLPIDVARDERSVRLLSAADTLQLFPPGFELHSSLADPDSARAIALRSLCVPHGRAAARRRSSAQYRRLLFGEDWPSAMLSHLAANSDRLIASLVALRIRARSRSRATHPHLSRAAIAGYFDFDQPLCVHIDLCDEHAHFSMH